MRIPGTRERVYTDGHADPFIIVHVDRDGETVDLIPVRGFGAALEDIPFRAIRAANQAQIAPRPTPRPLARS